MKTLYVTDLDGTLLTREERVSSYSLEKLNGLIEEGMLLTYATARSAQSAQRAVKGLSLHVPAILYNGGLIYDFEKKETLFCSTFEEEWKWDVFSVLRERRIAFIVFGAWEGKERLAWYTGLETAGIHRYLFRRRGDERLSPADTVEDLLKGYVFYFKCIGPREQLEDAWNILKYDSRFICIFHPETYSSDFWMEISPRAATKAAGVKFLRDHMRADRVVCFGDTSNDSDMFDICEEKYAVRNADDWLKAKATGVIGYSEEDGVAKWLCEHFRQEII